MRVVATYRLLLLWLYHGLPCVKNSCCLLSKISLPTNALRAQHLREEANLVPDLGTPNQWACACSKLRRRSRASRSMGVNKCTQGRANKLQHCRHCLHCVCAATLVGQSNHLWGLGGTTAPLFRHTVGACPHDHKVKRLGCFGSILECLESLCFARIITHS